MITKKFDKLWESTFQKFQGGGLLVGDRVVFRQGFEQDPWFMKQQPGVMAKITQMINSGNNLQVSSVKALRPAVGGGVQQDQQVDDYYVDVVQVIAPGRYIDFVTIPAELVEVIDDGLNLPPIPDHQIRDDTSHIDPVPGGVEDDGTGQEVAVSTQSTTPDKNLQNRNIPLTDQYPVDNMTIKSF